MIPTDTRHAQQQVQDSFLNKQGMEALSRKGREGDPEALKEVARKFESMFVHQMFKQMRATNEILGEDNPLRSEQTKHHEQMLDQQMSLELTKGEGLGLADMLYQQMQQAYGDHLNSAAPEDMDKDRLQRDETLNPSSAAPTREPAKAQGGKAPLSESPDAFVDEIRPHAEQAARELGVAPEALMAQAALETGWGQHVIHKQDGTSSHNLFNIKADDRWQGDRINVATMEYRDGLPRVERADFRQYNDLEESFADYVRFLQDNPRYREALAAGAGEGAGTEAGDGQSDKAGDFVDALQDAGYATDPAYADKLKTLMRTEPLMTTASDGPRSPDEA